MNNRYQPLAGQVALITGAGRGIGRAIATSFAHAGAAVACVARTQTEIEETARFIQATKGKSLAIPTDVTKIEQVEKMMETAVTNFGGLDILVINAGGNLDRRYVADSKPEDWSATINLNLNGAYLCARAAIPHLKARGGGKIIAIGSGLGHHGVPARAAYACSKAGLWMLTRVLAQELQADNISVNELIPGPVDTVIDAPLSPEENERAIDLGSNEWYKKPEDVIPLALFLATQPNTGPTAQSFSLMRRDT